MAISSPLNPTTITGSSRKVSPEQTANFLTGGSPLGQGVLANAANKIVGFTRGAAAVSPQVPDISSIIQTLSTSILNNVNNQVQSINQNISNFVNPVLSDLQSQYKDKMESVDDSRPSKLLQNFLSLYKDALGYVQFLGNRKNIQNINSNLVALQRIFVETFDVARLIRQVINKIVKQLSNLPKAGGGAGGLSLDVKVPGGPLRKSAPPGLGKRLRSVGKFGLAAGAGAMAVNALSSPGGDILATETGGEQQLSGLILDKFNGVLDRFSAAISALGNVKSSPSMASSGGGGGGGGLEPTDDGGGKTGGGGGLAQESVEDATAEGQVEAAGFDKEDFSKFRDVIASKESGGKYDIQGGSGDNYSGRYQLGADARKDAAKFLGEKYEGDDEAARKKFRQDPKMQERYFAAYTRANDSYLRGTPEYDALDKKGKLEVLAYAHNAGAGNAIKWLQGGRSESVKDSFGTKSDTYAKEVRTVLKGGTPPKLETPAVTGVSKTETPPDGSDATKVTSDPSQRQTQGEIAQKVSRPARRSATGGAGVSVAPPVTAGGGSQKQPVPASSGGSPPPRGEKMDNVPFYTSSDGNNFLSLHSKLTYNIVEG